MEGNLVLMFILFAVGITAVGILLIYFLVILKNPDQKPLTFVPTIDVIVIDSDNDLKKTKRTAKNISQHIDFIGKIYRVRHEQDILSKLALARLKRFFLIIKSSTLITSRILPEDLFVRDNIAYIHAQKSSISDVENFDEQLLHSMGLRFKLSRNQPVSSVPILADKDIVLSMRNFKELRKTPPFNFFFYFYPNYVLGNGQATLNKKYTFQYITTSVSTFDLVQRKFVIIDNENTDLHIEISRKLLKL